jgi:hypothetical protein
MLQIVQLGNWVILTIFAAKIGFPKWWHLMNTAHLIGISNTGCQFSIIGKFEQPEFSNCPKGPLEAYLRRIRA